MACAVLLGTGNTWEDRKGEYLWISPEFPLLRVHYKVIKTNFFTTLYKSKKESK